MKIPFPQTLLLLPFLSLTLPSSAQTVYEGDGEPLAIEEEIRWLLNRARFDRARENARRGTNYSDIPVRSGPVAPNASLTRSARRHCEDLARTNRFQHDTVPGSLYYNASTQKKPWDRMSAEGYHWNLAGENIAAGYTSALSVHVGWWISGAHRRNMGNAGFSEIGNGYHFRAASEFKDYYGMNLGNAGSDRFFTGTLFHDSNGNGAYNQNEGRAGGRVLLLVDGALHAHCDVSSSVGSFAVPIQDIPQGELVRVLLENTGTQTLTLSLPRDASTLETLELAPAESRVWGEFTYDWENVGFRDLDPVPVFLTLTPGTRTHDANGTTSATVEVTGSSSWTAVSNAPWLRVITGAAGDGDGVLTYAVDPHDFGDPRTASLLFTSEEHVTSFFNVTQTGVPAELQVAGEIAPIGSDGLSSLSLEVTANVTWQASSAVHWITLVTDQATGDGTLVFDVAPNAGSLPRETDITVSGGGLTRLIRVSQEAGMTPKVAQHLALDLTEGIGTLLKVTGLPPGLSWDKTSGLLLGQATRAGIHTLKVDVRLDDGSISKRLITLDVQGLPASAIGVFEIRLAQTPGVADDLGGELRFTSTASGFVSGVLRVKGKTFPFRDRLVFEETEGITLRRTFQHGQKAPLTLELFLGEDHLCAGTMVSDTFEAAVSGWRRVWSTGNLPVPALNQGRFHVLGEVRAPWRGDEDVPQGIACAVLTVSPSGRAVWSGKMGDGTPFLRSGWLGPQAQSGFWALLYAATGSVIWQGTLDDDAFGGEAFWLKGSVQPRSVRVYRQGFGWDERGQVALDLLGEPWTPPAPGQSLASLMGLQGLPEEWSITFAGGVMEDTASTSPNRLLGLDHQNQFLLPAPGKEGNESRLWLRANARTGWIQGGFTLLDENPEKQGASLPRKITFQGLLLPASRQAGGYFLANKLAHPHSNPPRTNANSDRVAGAMVLQVNGTP